MSTEHGLVQVYTGEGKGKTTAALGAAWRALGAGRRVYFLQFLKGGQVSSEQRLAAHLGPGLAFRNLGHPCTPELLAGRPTEEDRRLAREAWELARAALTDPCFDLVILDEVNNTLHLGLVSSAELLAALRARPAPQEVICTGRGAPPELLEYADLVTEMRAVKHPFQRGVPGREGLEY